MGSEMCIRDSYKKAKELDRSFCLGLKGLVAIKKGSPLYKKAKHVSRAIGFVAHTRLCALRFEAPAMLFLHFFGEAPALRVSIGVAAFVAVPRA